MNYIKVAVVAGIMLLGISFQAHALTVGEEAPIFSLSDTHGSEHALSDYRGRYVVLEWVNYDCPFVKKHYGSGNMQALQAKYTAQDVVWLSIASSAPGKQGYYEATEWNVLIKERGAAASSVLLDPKGDTGRLYGAKTTPHMYIVSPEGTLLYQGAIDNISSADQDDIPRASNYVAGALDSVLAGGEVPVASTKSYGCSVKY